MSIQDFYKKFVSATENNVLVESLRRLSLLDDPKAMLGEDPTTDWLQWTEASESVAAARA
ncbi:MAG TPA: hypothetical protein VH394_18055 [Thermoanaerobaculia bacterium]|jgi:hypothetical protein|nr:hypothetical protein [Thermoanaerobaculia bacterium]